MDNEQSSDRLPDNDSPVDTSANDEPQDERSLITAFALGELNDGEAAAMENILRDSTEVRQLVGELSRLGRLLRKVAADSPLPQPSSELRAAVSAELAMPPVEPKLRLRVRFPRHRIWLPLSLAASLAVVCGTLVALTKAKHAERAVAQADFIVANPSAVGDADDAVMEIAEAEGATPTVLDGLGAAEGLHDENRELPRLIFTAPSGGPKESGGPAVLDLDDNHQVRLQRTTAFGKAGSRAKPLQGGGPSGGGQRANQIASNDRGLPRSTGGFAGGMMGEPSLPATAPPVVPESSPQHHQGRTKPNAYYSRRRSDGKQQIAQSGPGMIPRGAGEAGADSSQREARFQLADDRLEAKSVELQLQDGTKSTAYVYVPTAESYSPLVENPFQKPTEYPLSTFSIDVDTASYTNLRRFLNAGSPPPTDAVRIEELINYFQYAYPQPEGDRPFSVTTDVADCPWNAEHRLLRVGLKGREVAAEARPAGNLVFLLDVSGSMEASNKLPLVKEAMLLLTEKLTENDGVAMVTYAGESGLALPPTNGTNKAAIREAISRLAAGGSTNGGQGLQMAYDTAQAQFIKGGTNRVILATDGDFNVGVVNQDDLVNLVADKAKNGVYLTALGFGMGNLKDGTLEKLADKGNGNYAYIDTLAEARRVLVEQLTGTLVTIAKDVKLQIEFNPAQAAEYRLIGYENRVMPPQDFHDDRKDAGEIGAGHTVTALYEIVPARAATERERQLKYQPDTPRKAVEKSSELATIQLRYKDPEASESRLIEQVATDHRPPDAASNADFQFAAAVAEFGMLLRQSPYRGAATYQSVLALAEQGLGNDTHGYRAQFIELVRQARDLSGKE